MADPTKSISKDKSTAEDGRLGISANDTMNADMFTHGLFWGAVVTVASWAVLAFGRGKSKTINAAAEHIEKWHGKAKGGVKSLISWISGNRVNAEHATDSAITSTSFAIGALAAKLALPSAAYHGRQRGKKAIEHYNNMQKENEHLKGDNKLLQEDIDRLSKALADVKRPDPAPETETGHSR